MISRTLFVAGLWFSLATPCFANNSYFIPGDAFFYFEIDQAEWEALKSGKLTIVRLRPTGRDVIHSLWVLRLQETGHI